MEVSQIAPCSRLKDQQAMPVQLSGRKTAEGHLLTSWTITGEIVMCSKLHWACLCSYYWPSSADAWLKGIFWGFSSKKGPTIYHVWEKKTKKEMEGNFIRVQHRTNFFANSLNLWTPYKEIGSFLYEAYNQLAESTDTIMRGFLIKLQFK